MLPGFDTTTNKHFLWIDGRRTDELPAFKKERARLARSEIDASLNGHKKVMKFPIIVEGKRMMIIISHETRTRFTKLSLGKYITTVKRKKLQDPELWPLTLVIADKDLKIGVYFNVRESCHDANRFELKINDVKYLDLPYEAP